MREAIVQSVFILCVTAVVILTVGTPDLLDAIIHVLMEK